jgi:hypothetical protein
MQVIFYSIYIYIYFCKTALNNLFAFLAMIPPSTTSIYQNFIFAIFYCLLNVCFAIYLLVSAMRLARATTSSGSTGQPQAESSAATKEFKKKIVFDKKDYPDSAQNKIILIDQNQSLEKVEDIEDKNPNEVKSSPTVKSAINDEPKIENPAKIIVEEKFESKTRELGANGRINKKQAPANDQADQAKQLPVQNQVIENAHQTPKTTGDAKNVEPFEQPKRKDTNLTRNKVKPINDNPNERIVSAERKPDKTETSRNIEVANEGPRQKTNADLMSNTDRSKKAPANENQIERLASAEKQIKQLNVEQLEAENSNKNYKKQTQQNVLQQNSEDNQNNGSYEYTKKKDSRKQTRMDTQQNADSANDEKLVANPKSIHNAELRVNNDENELARNQADNKDENQIESIRRQRKRAERVEKANRQLPLDEYDISEMPRESKTSSQKLVQHNSDDESFVTPKRQAREDIRKTENEELDGDELELLRKQKTKIGRTKRQRPVINDDLDNPEQEMN